MSRAVILDSSVLGIVSNPRNTPIVEATRAWLESLTRTGASVVIPKIADYELRRELLRVGKTNGLAKLDAVNAQYDYLALNTPAMRQAARFWAQARQQGQPTAADNTIDCDMILIAQAVTLGEPNFIIATTNVRHLARFVPADKWENIT